MATDISAEQAENLVRRLAQEVGYVVQDKAGYWQARGPSGHRINVQRSKSLGHIDTTLPVLGQEGTLPLKNGPGSNGSIVARIEPTLENLERYLRMLNDPGLDKKVARGPRPFAVRTGPAPRKPVPVATQASVGASPADPNANRPPELRERLKRIADRHAIAKQRRLMEEQGLDPDTAMAVAIGNLDEAEAVEAAATGQRAEVAELISSDGTATVEQ